MVIIFIIFQMHMGDNDQQINDRQHEELTLQTVITIDIKTTKFLLTFIVL